MEHVLRNVVLSEGHSLRNVVKYTITYELEPGTTYDAEKDNEENILRR